MTNIKSFGIFFSVFLLSILAVYFYPANSSFETNQKELFYQLIIAGLFLTLVESFLLHHKLEVKDLNQHKYLLLHSTFLILTFLTLTTLPFISIIILKLLKPFLFSASENIKNSEIFFIILLMGAMITLVGLVKKHIFSLITDAASFKFIWLTHWSSFLLQMLFWYLVVVFHIRFCSYTLSCWKNF